MARRVWEDNTKTNLKDVGWGGRGWVDVAKDRDQWRELVNHRVP
jgi:hypothetical protein